MVGSLDLLTTITSLVHIKVNLPNHQFVIATHIGTVLFNDNLVLTNVLFIPNFSVYLISASNLTSENSCCLIFLNKHCYIQDLVPWRTIGVAKIFHGLYHLFQKIAASPDSQSPVSCNFSLPRSNFLLALSIRPSL